MARTRRRGARRERGAVAVEAALVTPILVLLIFGILEFGMLFKDWLAVSNSVRAGVRIASAEPRMENYAQDAADDVAREGSALDLANVQELWVYRAGDDGTPDGRGNFENCTTCVKFRWNGSSFTERKDSWPPSAHNACQGDPGRMRVGVYVKYDHPSTTHFFFDDMAIADHAVMSLEPIPATRGCKP